MEDILNVEEPNAKEEKRYYYAQINLDNICFSVSDLTGEVESPYMIPIGSYDLSYLGKKYENGEWVNAAPEPEPEAEPTQLDRVEEAQLIIMEAMAAQYEENLEYRISDMEGQATIYETLLNMQGGM